MPMTMALFTAGTTLLFAQGTGAERVTAPSLAVQAGTRSSPAFAGVGKEPFWGIEGYKLVVPSPLAHVLGEGHGVRPLCASLMGDGRRKEGKGPVGASGSGAIRRRTIWHAEFEGRLPPEVISAVLERLGRKRRVRWKLEMFADWSGYLEETLPICMRDHADRVPEVRDALLLKVARGDMQRPKPAANHIPWKLVEEVRHILGILDDAESFLETTVSQCQSQYPVVPQEIIRRIAINLLNQPCQLDRSNIVSKTHYACRLWQDRHALLMAPLADVYPDDREKLAVRCQEAMMLQAARSGVLLKGPAPAPGLLEDILFDLWCGETSERAATAARGVLIQRLSAAHPGVPQELFEVVLNDCKAQPVSRTEKASFYGTARRLLRQWHLLPGLLEAAVQAVVPRETETREGLAAQTWRWLAGHSEWMKEYDGVTGKGRLLALAQDLFKGRADAMSGSDPRERVITRLQVKYPVLTRELIITIVQHTEGLPVVQKRPRALAFASENVVRHFARLADHLKGILKEILPMLPDPGQVCNEVLEVLAVRFVREARYPFVSILCKLSAPMALAQLAAAGVEAPKNVAGTQKLIRALLNASAARKLQKS